MSKKNGTVEAAVMEATSPVAAIDARLEALKQQRQQNAQQRAQLSQEINKLATEDAMAAGAIAMLQGLRDELEGNEA